MSSLGVLALCIAALGFGDAHRVASSDGSSIPWQMFGAGGAKYDDVAQGELGTCYFLAAVSAIAHRRPDLIQAMFVEQQLWKVEQGRSNPVYTTEWFINGEKLKVAVDGKVPVDSQTRPFFVKTHHGADAWPLVLEKAWAKIFGSFSAVSGGNGAEVYKAITQAPVERRPTIGNKQLWEQLTRAAESNWPMTGAVYKKNKNNLPFPHAYVVLDVSESEPNSDGKGVRAVRIYNPWGTANKYCGKMPTSDRSQGTYWMAFEEFQQTFQTITWAETQQGAIVSDEGGVITLKDSSTVVSLDFQMQSSEPFAVQLEWPDERFLPECKKVLPKVQLKVAKTADLAGTVVTAGKRKTAYHSNVVANMPGGAGLYSVVVIANFEGEAWLKKLVVNVYAKEKTVFTPSAVQDPVDTLVRMTGLCSKFSLKGGGYYHGEDAEYTKGTQKVNGIQVFNVLANSKGKKAQKAIVYFNRDHWYTIDSIESAIGGSYFGQVDGSPDWSCTEGKSTLIQLNADVATHNSHQYQEVMPMEEPVVFLQDTLSQATAESLKSASAACDDVLKKLGTLNQAAQIGTGGDDVFPDNEHSIGTGKCKDTSKGASDEDCSKYNNWDTFESIFANMEEGGKGKHSQSATCLRGVASGKLCTVTNTCSSPVVLQGLAESINTDLTYSMDGNTKGKVALAYCEVLYKINNNAVTGYTPFDPCAPKQATTGGGGAGDNGECLAGDVEGGRCTLINDCDDQSVEFTNPGYQTIVLNPGQQRTYGPVEACSDLTEANRNKFRSMCKDDGKECAGWANSCGKGDTVGDKTLDQYCSKTCGLCGPAKCLKAGVTKNNQCELINTCDDEPAEVKPEGFSAIIISGGETKYYEKDVCDAAPEYSKIKYLTECKDGRKDEHPTQCPGWKMHCEDKNMKVGSTPIFELCPKTCGCK